MENIPEGEPKRKFSAEPNKEGHYGDEDLAHSLNSELIPESGNQVDAHVKVCKECAERMRTLSEDAWSELERKHAKGFS